MKRSRKKSAFQNELHHFENWIPYRAAKKEITKTSNFKRLPLCVIQILVLIKVLFFILFFCGEFCRVRRRQTHHILYQETLKSFYEEKREIGGCCRKCLMGHCCKEALILALVIYFYKIFSIIFFC